MGSTRPDNLWSASSRMRDTARGGDNVGVVEKLHALLSGQTAELIFVLSLDCPASAISVPAHCQMRQNIGPQ